MLFRGYKIKQAKQAWLILKESVGQLMLALRYYQLR